MNLKDRSALRGQHAFLSPSQYHWVNYTQDKLTERYLNVLATQRGTELHDIASRLIELKIKLPRTKETLNQFVNDAIGYRMSTEFGLLYSPNAFGVCDALSFRKNLLRIHDLKTGKTKTSMTQLKTYAALFCLDYGKNPTDIEIILRIYQYDDYVEEIPNPEEIQKIIDKIIDSDKIIEEIKLREGLL